MLEDFQRLAQNGAELQRRTYAEGSPATLRQHITCTLQRCLPAAAVTAEMTEGCLLAIQSLPTDTDPLHTGAIHAYAGQYLLAASDAEDPLLQKLHDAAMRFLPADKPACRDDLRLVTLGALYQRGMLPSGMQNAYMRHRLGLDCPRLSCEEIALRMHKPLFFIHRVEAVLLNILSKRCSGGSHA